MKTDAAAVFAASARAPATVRTDACSVRGAKSRRISYAGTMTDCCRLSDPRRGATLRAHTRPEARTLRRRRCVGAVPKDKGASEWLFNLSVKVWHSTRQRGAPSHSSSHGSCATQTNLDDTRRLPSTEVGLVHTSSWSFLTSASLSTSAGSRRACRARPSAMAGIFARSHFLRTTDW